MAADDPTHNRPDLWHYPSDYAMRQAIPLHYGSPGNSPPSPVPLTDLFPVFASSPSVNKSTPVPILELCTVSHSQSWSDEHKPPAASATSLSLCLFDKCQDALAHVSSSGGGVSLTYEVLVSVVGGDERGAVAADLQKHFNSYNALEECAIRHCPTEYFISRSSICISLRHPYFVKRNMHLPGIPPRYSYDESFSPNDPRAFADYLARVRSSQRETTTPDYRYEDLGVRLPALPVGFPCDSALADQATGTIVRPRFDPAGAAISMSMTSAGTWLTAGDKHDRWALSHNATRGSGVVHSWMAKSTLFRGPYGMGDRMAERMRGLLASVPANMYSLGHCPRKTSRWTASKLTGEACDSSVECVLSMCVDGKCAKAASGKKMDTPTAFQSMERTYVETWDERQQETAGWWLAVVFGVVGGLVVLRVLVLANRLWWIRREQVKLLRASANRRGALQVDEPPAFEAAETTTGMAR